jgi:NIMA (never in mitosis gene a)-related kinase
MDNYTKLRIIGTGSFGTVWLARSKEKHRNYVLKEIPLSIVEERQRNFVLNEVKVLSQLRHMNIIRYKEAFLSNGSLCISMEYADEGMRFNFVLNIVLVLNCLL